MIHLRLHLEDHSIIKTAKVKTTEDRSTIKIVKVKITEDHSTIKAIKITEDHSTIKTVKVRITENQDIIILIQAENNLIEIVIYIVMPVVQLITYKNRPVARYQPNL